MSDVAKETIKSTQEQATASWVTYLNQCRLDELIDRLNQQDINLEEALHELEELKAFIGDPKHILGSEFTKHGEIAERTQVYIENARNAIRGLEKEYVIDDNIVGRIAPEDYLKNGQQVQSKFYNVLRNTFFAKHAMKEHLETYPDFVKNGGSYDIPKDQYELLVDLLDTYRNSPSKLSTPDYYLAQKIDKFLQETGLEVGKDINPAVVDYAEVQLATVADTVDKEEKSIKEEDKKLRDEAYEDSKPTLKEAAKVVGVSAAVEGGVSFGISVANKRKQKKFSEFTSDDWAEIGIDTGKGSIKGGVRGGAVYLLSNFTATPANVASAYVTAAFGIASQVSALENGKLSEEDFVINCETICLDVTVSAIASVTGQMIIPIPILGAIVGNIAGEFVYEICKKQGATHSQKIVANYNAEMAMLNRELNIQFAKVIAEIKEKMDRFADLESLAFDEDINVAFIGSIDLALEVGVDEEKILKSKADIDKYFLM